MLYSTLIVALAFAQDVQGPIGPKPGPGFAAETVPAQITGTVTTAGKPVAGARVLVVRRRYPLMDGISKLARAVVTTEATTDADGRYSVNVPAWRNLIVYAQKDGRISKVATGISWPETPEVPLALGKPWTVACDLRYAGKRLAGKVGFELVRISPKNENPPLTIAGESDEQGRIRVENLPDGPWQLILSGATRRLPHPVVLGNFVAAGTGPALVPTVELEDAITLAGQLQNTNGAPLEIAGVHIEALDPMHEAEATTDANGRFTLAGLQKGPGATLLVHGKGVVKTILATWPGLGPQDPAPQIVLRLRKRHGYSGRVVDLSGKPVAGADVLIKGAIHTVGIPVNDISIPMKTDENGRFSTDSLDPVATYHLIVMAQNGEAQPVKSFSTMDALAQTFRLGGRRAYVELQWKDGKQPTKPFNVSVFGPRESGIISEAKPLAAVTPNHYVTPCLLEGTYAVVVSSKEVGISTTELKIESGNNAPPRVEGFVNAGRARLIQGTVVNASGHPLADQQVRIDRAAVKVEGGGSWVDMVIDQVKSKLFPQEQFPSQVKSGKDGRFAIWSVEPTRVMNIVVLPPNTKPAGPQTASAETTVPDINNTTGEIKIVVK